MTITITIPAWLLWGAGIPLCMILVLLALSGVAMLMELVDEIRERRRDKRILKRWNEAFKEGVSSDRNAD